MNPIAEDLNRSIMLGNGHIMEMMSAVGRNLFFPKGILTQSAEAKEKAHRLNATVGIATQGGRTMFLDTVMEKIKGIEPEDALNYAPSYGLLPLRKHWQGLIKEKNPSLRGKEISLPVVTSGITHGLSVFADLWVDQGDVVILPDMMWGNYRMIFSVRKGAEIRTFSFFNDHNGFNLKAFEAALQAAVKGHQKVIVVLNFPHNPTGYTVTQKEAEAIADILTRLAKAGTNVVAVTDDSYFGFFYEAEIVKESLFSLLTGADPRLLAVKLDGATKENYAWGLRVAFCTYGCKIDGDSGPLYEALEKKTAGCVRGSISNASHLGQSLVLGSMLDNRYEHEIKEKYAILEKRAKRVKTVLADPKYAAAWDVYPFNSGYFMCIRLKTVDAEALRKHLLEKYGVGLIALGERDMRVAYSCLDEENILELFDIILKGVNEIE